MSTASKRYVVEWREPLVDVRELLLQRLQSRQDHQKPPRLHWLQDQLVPILAEDSFVAFELYVSVTGRPVRTDSIAASLTTEPNAPWRPGDRFSAAPRATSIRFAEGPPTG